MYGIMVLISYAVIMIGLTLLYTKKENNSVSFFVGDRKMGTVKSAMSIAATWIWAPALFVSAEKAYTSGIIGLFWFLVPNVLCLIFFIPFAKKIRKQMPSGITLSGYMHKKYKSGKVKKIYLFQLISLAFLSTAVQLLAGGKILSSITGIPMLPVTIILALIAYSYSQFSGIRASILTDDIQMVVILAVCAVFVPLALNNTENINGLITGLKGVSGEYGHLISRKGLEVFLSFGLPTAIGLIAGPFGDQSFWQRVFAVNEKKIGSSFVLGAFLFGLVPLSMGIFGFIAAGTGLAVADQNIVNFELVTHLFPKVSVIPFLFMILSGLLSTIDSNLCAVSSLTSDLCMFDGKNETEKMKLSKTSMLIVLAAGIFISNIKGLTVTHLFLFYCTLRATTMMPTVLTLSNKRLTENGVFFGVLVSLCVGLPVFAYGTLKGIAMYKTVGSLMALLLSAIIAVIISRMEGVKHEAD